MEIFVMLSHLIFLNICWIFCSVRHFFFFVQFHKLSHQDKETGGLQESRSQQEHFVHSFIHGVPCLGSADNHASSSCAVLGVSGHLKCFSFCVPLGQSYEIFLYKPSSSSPHIFTRGGAGEGACLYSYTSVKTLGSEAVSNLKACNRLFHLGFTLART